MRGSGRLAVAMAALAALGGVPGGAVSETRTLHLPTTDDPYIPGRPSRGRGARIHGKPHKHAVPHRGTSRRANRAAKRRKLRARAR